MNPNSRWTNDKMSQNRWNWNNRDDGGCAGRKGCDPVIRPFPPRVDRYNRLDKKVDKKVTPIVKEQAKTLSF